jgi:transcriptional antiterminator NusG
MVDELEGLTPEQQDEKPSEEIIPMEEDQEAEVLARLDEDQAHPGEPAIVEERVENLAPAAEEQAAVELQTAGEKPTLRRIEDIASRATSDEVPDLSQVPRTEGEHGDGRAWYVVHCYSGYENKVRHNLEQRIESMGMKTQIFDVVVPTEEEIEVKEGKRRTVERRVFPGYILVNMILTEESWYVVRNTPGVTSFVGQGNTPLPLRPEEVSQIVKRMEAEAPRIKVTFKQGERVRIVDGPFNDFRGTVSEIDMERAKVRVMVNFFGRETPVELDFLQVEKA